MAERVTMINWFYYCDEVTLVGGAGEYGAKAASGNIMGQCLLLLQIK